MNPFWWVAPLLTVIGFIATGIGLWYNWLVSNKISTNELVHIAATLSEIKSSIKDVHDSQTSCDQRLSKVEGFISAYVTFKK
jgi:hypothetical protein